MKSSRHIIFDVGGVLILNRPVNFTAFDQKFRVSAGTSVRIIEDCFNKSITDPQFDEQQYLADLEYPITHNQYKEICRSLYKGEWMNADLIDWIIERRHSYTFSILSNNVALFEDTFSKKYGFDQLFDHIFNSAVIGYTKPDPQIFEYIIAQLQTAPHNCVFVDDDLRNITAAKRLGLQTIQFQNNSEFFSESSTLRL